MQTGTGKLCLIKYNVRYVYAICVVPGVEDCVTFSLGVIAAGGRMIQSGSFCFTDAWELGSPWLMAPATWEEGGSFGLKASVIGVGRQCPIELYPGICLTSEENHGKLQSV